MNNFYLFIISISFFVSCQSQPKEESINVLFIGNSFTYFHNMPATLQEMLNETDPHFQVEFIAYPGMSIDKHLTHIAEIDSDFNVSSVRRKNNDEQTDTELKIMEKQWDYIILQTGVVQMLIPESLQFQVVPAIEQIMSLANNDCKFLIFDSWASEVEFPIEYCYPEIAIHPFRDISEKKYCSPEIQNSEGELLLINKAYQNLAEKFKIERAGMTNLYHEVSISNPQIVLIDEDGHPTEEGAFLNACVFYKLLTGKNPKKLGYTNKLNSETAFSLKQSVQ